MAAPRIEMAEHVVRPGLPQFSGRGDRRVGVFRLQPEAEDRHVAGRGADRHFRRAGRGGGGRGGASGYADGHRLLELRAGGERVGPGQRERPHVGLVGGVGPVALVLHLERVALHAAGDAQARRRLVGDGAQVHHRLHGVDQIREFRVDHAAVDMLDARRPAGHALDCMQHHEAGAVGDEVGDRPPLGAKTQAAARRAFDDGGVAELLLGIARDRVIGHREGIALCRKSSDWRFRDCRCPSSCCAR